MIVNRVFLGNSDFESISSTVSWNKPEISLTKHSKGKTLGTFTNIYTFGL